MRLCPTDSFDESERQSESGSNGRASDALELQVLAALQCACASSDLEVAEGLLSVLEIIDRRQNEASRISKGSAL